ncbi:MAG: hypothetical protein SFZ24_11145 [Planctomycetota bacterium]|nr:hypothetical protein [Planctomycetota bacterium]
MTNDLRSVVRVSAVAALAALAGVAFAADLDPTGQAGQYQTSRPAVLVKGPNGVSFAPSTVWVPFILQNDATTDVNSQQSLLNAAVVENIGGRPVGSITTFGANSISVRAPRVVAMLDRADAGSALSSGESNNVILNENQPAGTLRPLSSSHGTLLPDGTLVTYERFFDGNSTGAAPGHAQNNLGFWNAAHTLGVAEGIQAPFKSIDPSTINVGNATETAINPQTATLRGSVFIGVPSAVRDPNVANPVNDNDLLVAETHFNGSPVLTAAQRAAVTNGVVVYRGRNNVPTTVLGPSAAANCATNTVYPYTMATGFAATWLQASVPTPTTPAGECRTDARQTKPVIQAVTSPTGRNVVYVVHGVGFSGGSPFNGGSARPIYLAVDTIVNPDGSPRTNFVGSDPVLANNTILIEADEAGGVGAIHGRPYDAVAPLNAGYANHFVSDLNKKFVDSQATGGGSGPSTTTQFDMNARGQIAALWVDEGASPQRYEVRVYNPNWNATGERIESYTLANVVTFNGDFDNGGSPFIVTELTNTIETAPLAFAVTRLSPISGVSIDNDGRVGFTAVREKFEELGDFDNNPNTPDSLYLNNTTNSLLVWEPTTNSIHELLRGGQNGDVLADAFPADGPATNESLALGIFPVDAASDGFARQSLSRTGGFMAVNFRSGGNETVNGVNVELEQLPDSTFPTPDDFNDNGGVLTRGSGATLNERAVRGTVILALGQFTAVPPCCRGNASKTTNGSPAADVDFGDINAVLSNFNQVVNPNGTSVGDADCNGVVNFSDISTVLGAWLNNCD